jgi:hypothetical protein
MPEELFQDAFLPMESKPRVRQESGESEIREVTTNGPQAAAVSNQEVLRIYDIMLEIEKNRAGRGDGLQTRQVYKLQGSEKLRNKRGKNGGNRGEIPGLPGLNISINNYGNDNHGNDNQGNANQGNANQGNANQGNANQGNANQGNANQGNANQGNANHGNTQAGRSWCRGLFDYSLCGMCGMGTISSAAVILTAAYLYFKNPFATFESIPDVVLESLKKSWGAWASGGSNITNKEHKKNVRVPDETKGEHTHTDKKETKGEHTHTDQNETKGEQEINGFKLAMRELDCFVEPNSEWVSRQVQEVFKAIEFGTAGLRKVVGPEWGSNEDFGLLLCP